MGWRGRNRSARLDRRRWGRIGTIIVLAMILFLIYHRGLERQSWFAEDGPLAPEVLEQRGDGER